MNKFVFAMKKTAKRGREMKDYTWLFLAFLGGLFLLWDSLKRWLLGEKEEPKNYTCPYKINRDEEEKEGEKCGE